MTWSPFRFCPGQNRMPVPSFPWQCRQWLGSIHCWHLLPLPFATDCQVRTHPVSLPVWVYEHFCFSISTHSMAHTCSWAAFLLFLARMKGSISTGQCAEPSWGISETAEQKKEVVTALSRQFISSTRNLKLLHLFHIWSFFNEWVLWRWH